MGIIRNYFREKKARKIVLTTYDDETIDEKIKIQGTEFDRKRKYDKKIISKLKKEFQSGMSVNEIANKYDMNYTTVKYNVDPEFKKKYNETRNGKHTGVDKYTFEDRVNYKKALVKGKKIKVAGII